MTPVLLPPPARWVLREPRIRGAVGRLRAEAQNRDTARLLFLFVVVVQRHAVAAPPAGAAGGAGDGRLQPQPLPGRARHPARQHGLLQGVLRRRAGTRLAPVALRAHPRALRAEPGAVTAGQPARRAVPERLCGLRPAARPGLHAVSGPHSRLDRVPAQAQVRSLKPCLKQGGSRRKVQY